MRQTFEPGASDLVELFKQAANEGRITLMLAAPPAHDNADVPLITTCAMVFGLRPAESRALVKLSEQDHVTRQEMHVAMSGADCPVSDPRSIDTTICRLRKQLKPHGIEIVTRCKLGHQLLADSKAKVRKALAAYSADVVDAAPPPPGNTPSRPRRAKPIAA